MKLSPDASVTQSANAMADAVKGAKPTRQTATPLPGDFLLHLKGRFAAGAQTAIPAAPIPNTAAGHIVSHSMLGGGLELQTAPSSASLDVRVGRQHPTATSGPPSITTEIGAGPSRPTATLGPPTITTATPEALRSPTVERAAVNASLGAGVKVVDGARVVPTAIEARTPSDAMNAVSVDWPWLAIATGGLSYRPTHVPSASGDASSAVAAGISRTLAIPSNGIGEQANVEAERRSFASGPPSRPVDAHDAFAVDQAPDDTIDSDDFGAFVPSLPAELRELLERRRLRLVDDGQGAVRLFARDFALGDDEAAQWAASLCAVYQSMNQPLRALWINGRPYELTQGERHGR